jgi:hypothetical protein
MKTLLLLSVVVASLSACTSRGEDRPAPGPASVKIDSSGVVVDTSTH